MTSMPCNHYTDSEIAEMHSRYLAGDSASGWGLVLSKLPVIKKLCAKKMGYCGAELEDLVQEYLLHVYESLNEFDHTTTPFNIHICRVIHDGPNRILRKCRQLAGLPLSSQACANFKKDSDTVVTDTIRVSNYEPIVKLVAEVNDAIQNTDVDEVGVMALDLVGQGYNRSEISSILKERFPNESFSKGKLKNLIDSSIRQIQEVLGTTGTDRSLTHAALDRETRAKVLSVVLSTELGPVKVLDEILRNGIRVSYGYTQRLFKQYDVYARRERIAKGESVETHINEILALMDGAKTPKATTKPAPPPFDDISDYLWNLISPLLPALPTKGSGKRASLRLKTAVVIYRAMNGDIPFRELPETGIHWDVAWRWERQLKELGIFEQIIGLAKSA